MKVLTLVVLVSLIASFSCQNDEQLECIGNLISSGVTNALNGVCSGLDFSGVSQHSKKDLYFIFVMQSEEEVRHDICSRRGSTCYRAIRALFTVRCDFDINDGEFRYLDTII